MRKTTRFICESRKSFSVELLPATYYLCVEDEGGSKINSSSYSVSFLTKRISNQVPFNGSRQSPFKMILWENEIWPFNGSRRGKETQTLQYYVKTRRGMTGNGVYNGYVDPVLMLDGKSSSEESENYLESVLYVLDSDLKKQISLYFQNIAKTVDEKLQSGLYNKLKFEAVKTGLELAVKIIGFTPVGEAVNLLYDIVKFASGQSELASLIQFIARTSYSSEVAKLEGRFISQIVTHAYGLATAANALSFTDDVCLEIPRYYKIKKNVIRKNKYSTLIHWDLSTSYLNNGNVNYEELFAHEGLKFSPEVKIKGLDNAYRGSLHLLYGEDALARLLDSEAKSPDEI